MEENDDTRRPLCLLPERISAVGEEPAGVRVTPYHKAGAIRQILAVLDPDELFGSLKEVPVSSVLRMLEKKTVVDKDIRLKYAYLSLLASVILPTTHTPRISKECTEKIKDLDAFLA
ncbi:hypothetical protein F2Q69_00048079 [Brassica cretica]|uniref:DUF1985 domain-containing protein n=1 Tax=Brassica cretica TaxID=69181 RepID=A0A8S9PLS7_BRACR|nr:hypothetical protein F2Q69_00048079 [Brassica cretica]